MTRRSISKTRAVVTTGKPIHGNTNQTWVHVKEKIRMRRKEEGNMRRLTKWACAKTREEITRYKDKKKR